MSQIQTPAALVAAMLVGIVACAGGCRSYQAQPLDLAAHAEEWRSRSAGDAAVRSFIDELDARAGGPGTQTIFDPADGLSLAEAEVVALVFNAELRLARLRAGVARATADNAGLWEDAVFQLDVMRVLESVANPWVISPGLIFTVPLSGRLGAERGRASAALRAELVRIAEAEWTVRRELRQLWAAWTAMQLRADETRRLIAALKGLEEGTRRLAEAGEMARTESALFAIEQMQRGQELRQLDADLVLLELRIKRLMGLAPDALVKLVAHGLGETGAVASQTGAVAGSLREGGAVAERSLTLLRLREEHQAAEQTLRREVARQYPDLAVGPAYQSDQGQSRIGVLGGSSVPILNRNRQGIAEAEAQRELARAMYEVEYERIVSGLVSIAAHRKSLRAQRLEVERGIVPLVDRQLADAHHLLEVGEAGAGGGLVLLESLRRAHDLKLSLIELRLDETLAQIELMYLAGPDVGPEGETPGIESPAVPPAQELSQ